MAITVTKRMLSGNYSWFADGQDSGKKDVLRGRSTFSRKRGDDVAAMIQAVVDHFDVETVEGVRQIEVTIQQDLPSGVRGRTKAYDWLVSQLGSKLKGRAVDGAKKVESGAHSEPYLNLNFEVEFDGMPPLGYCSVEGFESAVEIATGRADKDRNVGFRPDNLSYSNLILRRGVTNSRALWHWYVATLKGDPVRRNGMVTVLNESREPVLTIVIRQAWPCRWKLSRLDAIQGEVLVEEIELVIRDFKLK